MGNHLTHHGPLSGEKCWCGTTFCAACAAFVEDQYAILDGQRVPVCSENCATELERCERCGEITPSDDINDTSYGRLCPGECSRGYCPSCDPKPCSCDYAPEWK
jgi:hypothetical protein